MGQNFVEFLFQLRVFQVKFMILAACGVRVRAEGVLRSFYLRNNELLISYYL